MSNQPPPRRDIYDIDNIDDIHAGAQARLDTVLRRAPRAPSVSIRSVFIFTGRRPLIQDQVLMQYYLQALVPSPLPPLPSPLPLPAPSYPELQTLPANATQVARNIFALPIQRALEYRPGKILKSLDKGRDNLEAALGQERGDLAPMSCVNCTKKNPKGPFTKCVIVPNFFDRACCNCRYNAGGSECTLHRKNAAPNDPPPPRSASSNPPPPKAKTPTRASKKAARLMKGKGKEKAVEEEEEEDEDGMSEDDISSDLGDDGNSEE
jgi:hypothetical protein